MTRPIVPTQIRKVFDGRVFSVTVESIPLPRGGRLEAEIIRHPGSVVLIPVTDRGEIVLVRQYRPAIGRSSWELPAGSLKHGEAPDRAAIRECHEETGLIPAAVAHLGAFFPTPGYCDEEMHFYRATGLRPPTDDDPAAHQDEDEDIEARAFPPDAIRAMITSGEIVDLKTVAGLLLIENRTR
ncbi:MAG: NUDIX hydrolase [Acidobacteria bacterium]|nr:NUDIX hydrolase [Acidobacteriota bacterium]